MALMKSKLVVLCDVTLMACQVFDDPETEMTYAMYDKQLLNFLIDHVGLPLTTVKLNIGDPIPPKYTQYTMGKLVSDGKRV